MTSSDRPTSDRPRLAVNPIAYWLAGGVPDRTTRTLGPAFTELAEIGYTAVKADVPDDMAAEDYLPWLASFGLEPALSLYNGSFDDRDTHAQQAEAARVFAARQASFGQRFCMISTFGPPGSPRLAHPAVGRGFDADRLKVVVDGIAGCCAAMRAGGGAGRPAPARRGLGGDRARGAHGARRGRPGPARLRAGHRAHVVGRHGRAGGAAGLRRPHRRGAPQGHLRRRHRPGRRPRTSTTPTATAPGRIWAEPGLGQVDLAACIAAFPADFAGDYMIEVDVPSVPLRECHQIAYDWARATPARGLRARERAAGRARRLRRHLRGPPGRDPGRPRGRGRRRLRRARGPARRGGRAGRLPGLRRPHGAAGRGRAGRGARVHAAPPARRDGGGVPGPRRLGAAGEARRAHPGRRRAAGPGRGAEQPAVLGVCFQNRYNDTARALRELLDRGELGRVLGGRASVTWFRDAAYYRVARLARPLGHRRRRGADEPGDPHPRPAAVVPRTGDGRPRHRGDAGAARRHRGGGHRRAAAAAPHRGRRRRHVGLPRHQRRHRERPGARGDHHRAGPRSGWTPTSP